MRSQRTCFPGSISCISTISTILKCFMAVAIGSKQQLSAIAVWLNTSVNEGWTNLFSAFLYLVCVPTGPLEIV